MSSPLPDRQLLVAFRNGPVDDLTTFVVDAPGVTPAVGHWTDLSAYAPGLSSYQIDRGVQHDLGEGVAGTLKLGLANLNGEFNPWIPSNGVTPGRFAPYLAGQRDGGTINTYGGLKLPVQVRDTVRGAQMLSVSQQNPGDVSGWAAGPNTVLSASAGNLTLTASTASDIYAYTINAGGIPSAPGYTHTAQAAFTAATTGRSVQILIQYYGVPGVGIIRQDAATGTDVAGSPTTLNYSGVSPAGTVAVAMFVYVVGAANGEGHAVTSMSLQGPVIIAAFTGHATAWRALWPGPVSAWAELEASDAFRYFNDLQLGNADNATYTAALAGFTHYWPCNDAPGATTLVDAFGGAPATLGAGSVSSARPALGGTGPLLMGINSGEFDTGAFASGGGQGYVQAPAGLSGGIWTLLFWVDGLNHSGNPVLFNQSTGGANSVKVTANVAPYGLEATFINNAGSTTIVDITFVTELGFQDGGQHFVGFTFDGTTLVVYIDPDGVVRTGVGVGGIGAMAMNSATPTFFGAADATTGALGGVKMSDLGILNGVAFTPAQMTAAYKAAVGFVSESTGQRIQSTLAPIGWPANLEILDAGNQVCQQNTQNLATTTLLTHLQDVESTEEGAVFVAAGGAVRFVSRQNLATQAPFAVVQCWFGDEVPVPGGAGWDVGAWDVDFTWGTLDVPFGPGTDPVLDDTDHTTGATVTRVGGLAQTVGGGTRVRSVSGVLHTTDAGSLAHAVWITAKDGVPVGRLADIKVDLTEFLGDPDAVARVLSARELLSRVYVERTEVGFVEVGLVEHTSETTTADSWDIVFSLSTADTFAAWNWGGAQ